MHYTSVAELAYQLSLQTKLVAVQTDIKPKAGMVRVDRQSRKRCRCTWCQKIEFLWVHEVNDPNNIHIKMSNEYYYSDDHASAARLFITSVARH